MTLLLVRNKPLIRDFYPDENPRRHPNNVFLLLLFCHPGEMTKIPTRY